MARARSHLRTAAAAAALALGALCAAGREARAQSTVLTVSSGVITFPAPTAADFATGWILYATPVSFTVNATGGSARVYRFATVSVRATAATLGGGKPTSDLEWSRLPAGPWQGLSTLPAAVDTKPMQKNKVNDPWSGTIYFRMRLAWATDTPRTYSTGLEYQLTVATQ
jgi:hypothetical protein